MHCFVPFEYFGADLLTSVATLPQRTHDAQRSKVAAQAGLQTSAARVENGPTHDVIRSSWTGEADVVVMGVLARGRIKDWLIGSTAERVLHGGRSTSSL